MFRRWLKGDTRSNGLSGAGRTGSRRLIELRGVVKEYATAAGPFPALRGIDLTVEAGQFVGVVGRSGAGKSTLLNMIAGLDRPTRGEVYVGGAAVHRFGENDLTAWRGANVGIVFQSFQLLPNLSNVDNVMLPMDFAGRLGAREQRERAMSLLAAVDVAEHAGKLPSAISGGQQQRVAIARALANDPPLILADEPTGNLDSKTADSIFDLFAKLASDGKTLLLISHDPDLASRVARTISVSDGEIVDDSLAVPLLASGAAGRG
jgi:putative ABC transport system ATP-binding protein